MRSKRLTAVDQPQLALTRKVDRFNLALELVINQRTLLGAIALCVQMSGLEDKEVYMALGIDAGHWNRIMKKGEAHFPVSKLSDLMDLCGNEAPLMWLAHHRGYGLVVLQSEAEKRAEAAELALRAEREKTKLLMEIVNGGIHD
mgnify:CR=1 FL=1